MTRTQAIYMLAGYLSTLPEYRDKHPEELVPLAESIINFFLTVSITKWEE